MNNAMRSVAVTLAVLAVAACSQPDESQPPRTPAQVPAWLDAGGNPVFDDAGPRWRDMVYAKHGVFAVAGASRDSELAHADYRPALAGEPRAQRARLWLELVQAAGEYQRAPGVLAPHLTARDGHWRPAGAPRLEDYAAGVYAYHMHHRAGRWADQGLDDTLTYYPVAYFSALTRHVLDHHYADGRFYADTAHQHHDAASMAWGLSAAHALFYAWYRHHKEEGADDMGRVSEQRLRAWLGYDPDDLLVVARETAAVLDAAWSDQAGVYVLEDSAWELDALGALLRGKKALWEHLHVFGDDEDAQTADVLAARALSIVRGVADTARPWGLPATLHFSDAGVRAAGDEIDLASHWSFVADLVAGHALLREREGAQLLSRDESEPLVWLGGFIDAQLATSDFHIHDGVMVSALDADNGAVTDARVRAEVLGAFLVAALEGYGAGTAFARAADWDPLDEAAQARSRALYDAVMGQSAVLEQRFLDRRLDDE